MQLLIGKRRLVVVKPPTALLTIVVIFDRPLLVDRRPIRFDPHHEANPNLYLKLFLVSHNSLKSLEKENPWMPSDRSAAYIPVDSHLE